MSKPQYILMQEWAAAKFSPPPGDRTLRNWRAADKVRPRPVKVGRSWQVRADAELRQQLFDEKRRHEVTRVRLKRARLVRDEALHDLDVLHRIALANSASRA